MPKIPPDTPIVCYDDFRTSASQKEGKSMKTSKIGATLLASATLISLTLPLVSAR